MPFLGRRSRAELLFEGGIHGCGVMFISAVIIILFTGLL